jgi:hypothetical protein
VTTDFLTKIDLICRDPPKPLVPFLFGLLGAICPSILSADQCQGVAKATYRLLLQSDRQTFLRGLAIFERVSPSWLPNWKFQKIIDRTVGVISEDTGRILEPELLHFLLKLSDSSPLSCLQIFRRFPFAQIEQMFPVDSLLTLNLWTFLTTFQPEYLLEGEAFRTLLGNTFRSNPAVVGFGYYSLMELLLRQRAARFPLLLVTDEFRLLGDQWIRLSQELATATQSNHPSRYLVSTWVLHLIDLTFVFFEVQDYGRRLETLLAGCLTEGSVMAINDLLYFYRQNRTELRTLHSFWTQNPTFSLKKKLELILRTISVSFEAGNHMPFNEDGFNFSFRLYEDFLRDSKSEDQLLTLLTGAMAALAGQVAKIRLKFYEPDDFPGGFFQQLDLGSIFSFAQMTGFCTAHFKFGRNHSVEYTNGDEGGFVIRSDEDLRKALQLSLQKETLFGDTLTVRLLVRKPVDRSTPLSDLSFQRGDVSAALKSIAVENVFGSKSK